MERRSADFDTGAPEQERVLLVAVDLDYNTDWTVEDSLDELAGLVHTAGGVVVGRIVQKREKRHPRFYVGSGKISEIRFAVNEERATLVVFDDELSPVQVRSIEAELDTMVLDRSQVILDIFAQRAHTREGQLQVELAQLEYLLPRLTGKGVELSRLGGGIGTRGPGETQLEVDRRRMRRRIGDLKKQVSVVGQRRALLRERRHRSPKPVVALVGYTNAGKSTLLKALTGAEVLVEDKLFATLDPTVRSVEMEAGPGFFLVDTVGFINKLPHQLVAAFRATLEEAVAADIIVHVVDASNPNMDMERRVVHEVLTDLGVSDTPIITAFNKADRLEDEPAVLTGLARIPDSVLISALTGQGLDHLLSEITEAFPGTWLTARFAIPYTAGDIASWLHEHGRVLQQQYEGDLIYVTAELSATMAAQLDEYRLPENPGTAAVDNGVE